MSVHVQYTFGTPNLVTVEILVEPNFSVDLEPKFKLTPALPALPKGTYHMTWVLVPGEGVTNPEFDEENGIEIDESTKPPLVGITDSHRGSDPRFWEAEIDNQVQGANAFHYDAHGTADLATNGSSARLAFLQQGFNLDPTVAVTPDPPPGG